MSHICVLGKKINKKVSLMKICPFFIQGGMPSPRLPSTFHWPELRHVATLAARKSWKVSILSGCIATPTTSG